MRHPLMCCVFLSGCLVRGGVYEDRLEGLTDEDGDGHFADQDCDDADASVYPAAVEACDGLDNNCDGAIDEEVTSWYLDQDADGYGNSAVVEQACAAPDGYAGLLGDCNDQDDRISPDALEFCDGDDNDCDGVTDEDDAEDAVVWFPDADEDGYGDDGLAITACSQPSDHLATGGDCDDTSELVNPGAGEVCNDNVDNDCDGEGTPCEWLTADASAGIVGLGASHQVGETLTVCDLDGDGVDDLMFGATRAGEVGAVYVVYGPIVGAEVDVDALPVLLGEHSGAKAGSALACGDVNGDDYADLLVGSWAYDPAGLTNKWGAAYLVHGAPTRQVGERPLAEADARFVAQSGWDALGQSLAFAGDLDGDGYGDFALGAYWANALLTAKSTGAVYVIYGPVLTGGVEDASTIEDRIIGSVEDEWMGAELQSAGDVDGDGRDDLFVGTYNGNIAGGITGTGAVFVGPVNGVLAETDADATLHGATGDLFGSAAVAGNFNGLASLAISAQKADEGALNSGTVYIFDDPLAATGPGDAVATITHSGAEAAMGHSLTAADFDGDGEADLLVGAATEGFENSGAAYLVLGPFSGTSDVAERAAIRFYSDAVTSTAVGIDTAFSANLGNGGAAAVVGAHLFDSEESGFLNDVGAVRVFWDLEL